MDDAQRRSTTASGRRPSRRPSTGSTTTTDPRSVPVGGPDDPGPPTVVDIGRRSYRHHCRGVRSAALLVIPPGAGRNRRTRCSDTGRGLGAGPAQRIRQRAHRHRRAHAPGRRHPVQRGDGRLLDRDPAELVGRTFFDVTHPDDLDDARRSCVLMQGDDAPDPAPRVPVRAGRRAGHLGVGDTSRVPGTAATRHI